MPFNRGQSQVVQALAGYHGDGVQATAAPLPGDFRVSGPRRCLRLSDAASDPPPSPEAGGAGWPRAPLDRPHLRGELGIRAERQRGCKRDGKVIETGDRDRRGELRAERAGPTEGAAGAGRAGRRLLPAWDPVAGGGPSEPAPCPRPARRRL